MILSFRQIATVALAVATTITLAAAEPRPADEHIVLNTIGGDIVFELYPDIAPGHVAHLLQLTRLGAYDSTHILRLDPLGYYIQISGADDRAKPLNSEQRSAVAQRLPAEFGPLRHLRGMISMAREPGRPDSAGSSFSIIRRNAPHLDPPNETYTIVGRVVQGMDVVDYLATLRRPDSDQPIRRLPVLKAVIVDAIEVAGGKWRGPHVVPTIAAQSAASTGTTSELQRLTIVGFIASGLCGFIAFLSARKLPGSRSAVSFSLLVVLTSAFMLVILLVPLASVYRWLGFSVLAALLLVVKLMTFFDTER